MRYGEPYVMMELEPEELNLVLTKVSSSNLKVERGSAHRSTIRESSISWVEDQQLNDLFFCLCHKVNIEALWNLQILGMENFQYTTYDKPGDHYGWHVDQGSPDGFGIRKISMSLFLSDPEEYEGGELELEVYPPSHEKRSLTFKEKKGVALFFQSDVWHRVCPIKSGSRKSLVAWFRGCPYV